jgi:cell wall-associated NlpC family hydrolase
MIVDIAPFIGRPYRIGARGPDAYDCWGLVRAALGGAGLVLPDYQAIDRAAIDASVAEQARSGAWQPVSDPCPGDLLLLGPAPRRLWHIGLCTSAGVLHTTPSTGACVQPLAVLRRSLLWRHVDAFRWVGSWAA